MTGYNKNNGYLAKNIEFLQSPAMKKLSYNCLKFLHFLEIEHLKKGWANNGELKAPYNQLQKFGISRRYINLVIWEAEQRGLVIVERGARIGRKNYDNTYILTYAKCKGKKHKELWKDFTEKDFLELLESLKKLKKKKIKNEVT